MRRSSEFSRLLHAGALAVGLAGELPPAHGQEPPRPTAVEKSHAEYKNIMPLDYASMGPEQKLALANAALSVIKREFPSTGIAPAAIPEDKKLEIATSLLEYLRLTGVAIYNDSRNYGVLLNPEQIKKFDAYSQKLSGQNASLGDHNQAFAWIGKMKKSPEGKHKVRSFYDGIAGVFKPDGGTTTDAADSTPRAPINDQAPPAGAENIAVGDPYAQDEPTETPSPAPAKVGKQRPVITRRPLNGAVPQKNPSQEFSSPFDSAPPNPPPKTDLEDSASSPQTQPGAPLSRRAWNDGLEDSVGPNGAVLPRLNNLRVPEYKLNFPGSTNPEASVPLNQPKRDNKPAPQEFTSPFDSAPSKPPQKTALEKTPAPPEVKPAPATAATEKKPAKIKRESKNHVAPPGEYFSGTVKEIEGHGTVMLTFDDGPDFRNTGEILDRLLEANVKATFFVQGVNITEKTRPLLMRMIAEGHQIALHSYNHANMSKKYSDPEQAYQEQVAAVHDKLLKMTGVDSNIFRPPEGALSRPEAELLKSRGFRIVYWGDQTDTEDWRSGVNSTKHIVEAAKKAKPGDIVLMHDAGGAGKDPRAHTKRALPEIIKYFKENNVVPVTVNQGLGLEPITHSQIEAALVPMPN